jgi:osmotically-inducible protein OsmY
MPRPILRHYPSLDSTAPDVTASSRPSLFDHKDAFIDRVAPLGAAAIYFGDFVMAPQDAALSRQALFKLSFLHRHFLQPGGIRISVQRQTAILFGTVAARALVTMADILARQIEGIEEVKDETVLTPMKDRLPSEPAREATTFLFATDQTLRTGLYVLAQKEGVALEGEVPSALQKQWAEQLALSVGGPVDSRLKVNPSIPSARIDSLSSPSIDDESLQALILLRLQLTRDAKYLPVWVKVSGGTALMQGKVRTEALRQRAENIARATLGVVELRSSISISAT